MAPLLLLRVEVHRGTYTYNIGAGNQASSTFTGLSAGNYTVSVTDINGCLATSTVTVTQPTALTASVVDENGSATPMLLVEQHHIPIYGMRIRGLKQHRRLLD